MSRSPIGAPALVLLCFAFLAGAAWTGGLVGIGNFRSRPFAWLVEDIFVYSLGRSGAAAAFAGLGVALAAIVYGFGRKRQRVSAEPTTGAPTHLPRRPFGKRVENDPIRERPFSAPPGDGSVRPPVTPGEGLHGAELAEQSKLARDESMGTVFISTAMVDCEARKPLTNAVLEVNYQDVIPFDKKNASGEPMGAGEFPEEAWVGADADERECRQLPNLFYAGGFWFVSAKAAAVLGQLDLGAGALYPVKIFATDRQTPLGEGWYCINFGNRKTAFLPEQCHRVRPIVGGKWPVFATLKDDEFAVSTEALEGPDVWVDSQVRGGIFFSERLGRALKKAKAAHGFYLRSCRVIG